MKAAAAFLLVSVVAWASPALAQKYGPGVSDTEIRIGNTMPYSGPVSAFGLAGRVMSGYFDEINGKGGINGRKLNLLSLDDAFSPPKTVEAVRRLVESDNVAFIFGTSFEVADPTVDSQVLTLASTKADVFMIYSVTPRACAQAIRKAYEAGWQALRFISSGCANRGAVMAPAGIEAANGILSLTALKPYDAETAKDPGLAAYTAFMAERFPGTDPNNSAAIYGYYVSQALVALLERCGNDLTRENIMAQAASLKNVELPMLMPGIALNTSKDDFRAIKDGYMVRFDGDRWVVISDLLRGR